MEYLLSDKWERGKRSFFSVAGKGGLPKILHILIQLRFLHGRGRFFTSILIPMQDRVKRFFTEQKVSDFFYMRASTTYNYLHGEFFYSAHVTKVGYPSKPCKKSTSPHAKKSINSNV
jgi:hypothetical protein